MPDELLDQLRRYGEALERSILPGESGRAVVVSLPSRGPRRRVLAVAAASFVVVAGAALVALARDDPRLDHVTTAEDPASTSTAPVDATTTRVAPLMTTLNGSASWTGGPDARATLRVGACPVDAQPGCPELRSASVEPDGSFALVLPIESESRQWRLAAYVTLDDGACVFNCQFPARPQGAVVGPSMTVSPSDPPQASTLPVAARVVDVYVRDRDGKPFVGGGVQVTDLRCRTGECPDGLTAMFVPASDVDGAARVVVDPSATYEVHGQASNTGWPEPQYMNDGSAFWFSPAYEVKGSDLRDGHVFLVDGAPPGG